MENQKLDDYFGYTEAGSSLQGEMRAGLTTFMTMAYILFVNPDMLASTGIPFDDALFATAMAAFVGCVIMGLWANQPYALAPGMGLNAFFAFTVAASPEWGGMGIPWDVALAAVLVEGVLFMIIPLPQVGWRSKMINAIPRDLKIATMAGIGMFLAIIGFREMGWVANDPATLVTLNPAGAWTHTSGELWALIGLTAIAVMMARGIKGAIIFGVAGVTVASWAMAAMGYDIVDTYNFDPFAPVGEQVAYAAAPEAWFGFVGLPEDSMGAAIGALGDIGGSSSTLSGFLLVMITFLFVDIFDTAGTLYGVGKMAGKVNEDDQIEAADEAFMADAGATIVGALCGTSTTTTYIESAAGIEEGGKTGLTAVVVGVLMLSGLFLAGIFKAIPAFAAAPALVVVGAMMMKGAAEIDWNDKEMAIPAFVTIAMMPFTYSIANGIAWGVITYVLIKMAMQKWNDLNPIMYTVAGLLLMFYLGPGDQTTFEWLFSYL